MARHALNAILFAATMYLSFSARASPALSPQAATLIAPVHDALARVKANQARQRLPQTVSERLLRLEELDQAGRDVMQMIDLSPLPPVQREAASTLAWNEINAQDAADRAGLEALLPQQGWFTISSYGQAASDAAWSVVQHQTNDPPFMAAMLTRMEGPARRRDVNPRDFALLYDRVAMVENRPQTYGSQFVCTDHRWKLYKLNDPNQVDQRRKALGLTETEEQVEAEIASYAACFIPKHTG
ncbi:MAG: DUF6624 domain-containing protein [Janthinobacterium lividum]